MRHSHFPHDSGHDPERQELANVAAFLLAFRGLRLVGSAAIPLDEMSVPSEFIGPDRIIRRLKQIKLDSIKAHVTFDWSGTSGPR